METTQQEQPQVVMQPTPYKKAVDKTLAALREVETECYTQLRQVSEDRNHDEARLIVDRLEELANVKLQIEEWI